MTTNATTSSAGTATLLTGRIAFGDLGTGSIPLDGELALSSAGGPPWESTLSTNALQAAEGLSARRQNARTLSHEEATAITRVAFDVDLAFLGLAANWGTARLTPITGGAVIEVEATVRPAPPRPDHAKMRAAVRMELIDGTSEFAEFTLTDTSQTYVEHRQDIEPSPPAQPGIDALAAAALHALDHILSSRALPARTHWQLSYTEAPVWERRTGTCGELEVWTIVTSSDAPRTNSPTA